MSKLRQILGRALIAGSVASVTSGAALALRGRSDTGGIYAPLNAPSHWIWGERAIWQGGPSLRHTATGFAIHHASSVFWAVQHEAVHSRDPAKRVAAHLRDAALTTALAAWVDLRLVPDRLTPGFQRRLSGPSLLLVYGMFAFGLALGSYLARSGERKKLRPGP
jgi:hypothetical protein